MKHEFCRTLLKEVMRDVRKHVPAEKRKKAWTHKGCDYFQFCIPCGKSDGTDFNCYPEGDCKWSAKSAGWQEYLRHLGKE